MLTQRRYLSICSVDLDHELRSNNVRVDEAIVRKEEAPVRFASDRLWAGGSLQTTQPDPSETDHLFRQYHLSRRTIADAFLYAKNNASDGLLARSVRLVVANETSEGNDDVVYDVEPTEHEEITVPDPEEFATRLAPPAPGENDLDSFDSIPSGDFFPGSPGGHVKEDPRTIGKKRASGNKEDDGAPKQKANASIFSRLKNVILSSRTAGDSGTKKERSFRSRMLRFLGHACLLLAVKLLASKKQWQAMRTLVVMGSVISGPQQSIALAFFQPLAVSYAGGPTFRRFAPGISRAFELWEHIIPIYLAYKMTQRRTNKADVEMAKALWDERHSWGSERIRRLCMELRGFYLKEAHFLSTRTDVLPSQWCVRLSKIHDHAPPVSIEEVRSTVLEAFGMPMESIFLWYDRLPLATATVAQVHRCEMPDGRSVILKAQYANQEKLCLVDLRNLRFLARFMQAFETCFDLVSIVREFERQIPLEFDFEREARMMNTIRRNLRHAKLDHILIVPEIVNDLVARRALVMTYVPGCRITDAERLMRWELNAQTLLENVVSVFGQMMLVDGVFHADPNPDNFIAMQDGRVALVDFGQVKRLHEFTRRRLCWLYLAIAEGDDHAISTRFQELGIKINNTRRLRTHAMWSLVDPSRSDTESRYSQTDTDAVSDTDLGDGIAVAPTTSSRRPSSHLSCLFYTPTDTDFALYARCLFDPATVGDELTIFGDASPLKFVRFQEFPQDIYMAIHSVQLLRELGEQMHVSTTISTLFCPFAAKGIRKVAPPSIAATHSAAIERKSARSSSQSHLSISPRQTATRTHASGAMGPNNVRRSAIFARDVRATSLSDMAAPGARSVSAPNSPIVDSAGLEAPASENDRVSFHSRRSIIVDTKASPANDQDSYSLSASSSSSSSRRQQGGDRDGVS